jgi:hypothetical protein
MSNVPMKEIKSLVVVDDLELKIKNVAFEAKVFNMTPLIELQIGAWKIHAIHICIMICSIGQF